MTLANVVPKWFFGTSIFMSFLITLITLAVSFYSFQIFRLCRKKEIGFFGLGFLMISLSYVFWSIINLLVILNFQISQNLGVFLLYGYFLLFIAGFATLTFTTFKIKGKRAYLLFVTLSVLALILAFEKASAFFIVSIILLVFIIYHCFCICVFYFCWCFYSINSTNSNI